MQKIHRDIYRFADLVLDVEAMTLHRETTPIAINGLSFDLLLILVRQAPKVVSREQLLEEIWQGAFVGEETLKQRVRLLRKALGDDSKQPRYIETVRGKGYKLACSVAKDLSELNPTVSKAKQKHFARLSPWLATACLLGFFVWLLFWQNQKISSREVVAQNHALNENLIAKDLFESALVYYKRYLPKDNKNAIELLKQAINQDPLYAKAYALLSKAYSQQPKLGNGSFDREALEAAQQAISLSPQRAEGYDALGLHYDVNSRPKKALQAYEMALQKDPAHGSSLANAAFSLMLLGDLEKALALNAKALKVYPEIQYGNIQLGDTLRLLELDSKAESWLRKAVTLQPDNVFANVSLAKMLLLQNRFTEALSVMEKTTKSTWGKGLIHSTIGDVYLFQGEFEQAEAHYQQSEQAGDGYASYRLSTLSVLQGKQDAKQGFAFIETKLLAGIKSGNEYASMRLMLASIKAWAGNETQAYEWLDQALASGWTDLRWLTQDPGLKALRDLPGFETRLTSLRSKLNAMQARVIDQKLIP